MFEKFQSRFEFQPKFKTGGPARFHLPLLYELAALKKPKSILTLGFGDGAAFFTFCQAAREKNIECRCAALRRERVGKKGSDDLVWQKSKNYGAEFYKGLTHFFSGSVSEAAKEFCEASIDLLLLDDCESGSEIRADLSAWESKLAPNGLLIVHGIALERADNPGDAWRKWTGSQPAAEFLDGIGLGVTLYSKGRGTREFFLKLLADRSEVQETMDHPARALTELEQRLAALLADHTQTRQMMEEHGEGFEALRRDRARAHLVTDNHHEMLTNWGVEIEKLKVKTKQLKAEINEQKRILSVLQHRPLAGKIVREIRRLPRNLGISRSPKPTPAEDKPPLAAAESERTDRYAEWVRELEPDSAALEKQRRASHQLPVRPRILFVSHDLSLSGAPIMLFHAAQWCQQNGIFVVVMAPKGGPLTDRFLTEGIPIIIDPLIETGHESFTRFARHFDCIVANTILSSAVVHAIKRENVPIAWWIHEPGSVGEHYIRADARLRAALPLADVLFTPSERTAWIYRPFNDRPARCIRNAIPDIGFRREENDGVGARPLRFLLLASVEPRKGQDVFVQALASLPRELQEAAQFQIAGRILDPDWWSKVAVVAKALKNFSVTGALNHEKAIEMMSGADIIISASRDEAMPTVTILEAMSLGKALIVTNVGGACEVFVENENALLVRPEAPEALAAAIRRFIENPALAAELGEKARATYEKNFTMERFGAEFRKLLDEVIATFWRRKAIDRLSIGAANDNDS